LKAKLQQNKNGAKHENDHLGANSIISICCGRVAEQLAQLAALRLAACCTA